MAKIPKFKTLDEAAEFWDVHGFEDYVEDTEPVTIAMRIARRNRTLMVPVESEVYSRMEALAARRGLRVEKMVAAWLEEKAMGGDGGQAT